MSLSLQSQTVKAIYEELKTVQSSISKLSELLKRLKISF